MEDHVSIYVIHTTEQKKTLVRKILVKIDMKRNVEYNIVEPNDPGPCPPDLFGQSKAPIHIDYN